MALNDRILCISDMHQPYSHPDTFRFLEALEKKYKFTRIVCLGDEVDNHAMSFHDSDPDLPSAGPELRNAIKKLRPIYDLFPVVDLVNSNHGSLYYRKGKHHGIPRKALRDYNELLEAPEGWTWHDDLLLRLPTGNHVYFHHGLSSEIMNVVAKRGVCVVQGHFHMSFGVRFVSTPLALLWGLQIGCSIDKKSLAFAYDKLILDRPVIGHGAILEGWPKPLPMILNRSGRWTGYVP